MSKIDLHTHSIASDGTLTPTQLIERAKERDLSVIAMTDHDTIDGIAEGQIAADRLGLTLVPGVELSVLWGRLTVHVVGLGVDPSNEQLQAGLERHRAFRVWRGEEMGRRLEKRGVSGALEHARTLVKGGIISRTHFARVLIEQQKVKNVGDAFKRYLKRGRPGYVAGEWCSLEEGVEWIHAAGGVAVMAHPMRYQLSGGRRKVLLQDFQECGGEAVEVCSSGHSSDEVRCMVRYAEQFGFQASQGSDFHTPENRWSDLGCFPRLPDGCRPVWEESLPLAEQLPTISARSA